MMKKMGKYLIAVLLLLACLLEIPYRAHAEVFSASDTISVQRTVDKLGSAAYYSTVIERAKENGYQLDSIFADEKVGHCIEKRKWLFEYDNSILKERKEIYYGETYDIPLKYWTINEYNNDLTIHLTSIYQKYISSIDSIFATSYTQYYYNNGKLSKINSKGIYGYSASTKTDSDGNVISYTIDLRWNESNCYYQYNENGLLSVYYYNLLYNTTGTDSTYAKDVYNYDENNKRKSMVCWDGAFVRTVDKYSYEETGNSYAEITNWFYYSRIYPREIDPDTVTVCDARMNTYYRWIYDVQGRDSIYSSEMVFLEYEWLYTNQKIHYFYNEEGLPDHEVYYIWDGIADNGEWVEQIHVQYTYDTDGKLTEYEKTYYDNEYNSWELMQKHCYYYSKIGQTSSPQISSDNSITVYPNPASETLYFDGLEEPTSYRIYNLSGSLIKMGQITGRQINLSGIAPGTYFLKLFNNQTTTVRRFVKKF